MSDPAKKFRIPAFDPKQPIDCTAGSVDYNTYARATNIRSNPHGFEDEDVVMASYTYQQDKEKEKEVEDFLAQKGQNKERDFQIGIAYVGRKEGRSGHAAVVLQDYDLSARNPPSPFALKFDMKLKNKLSPTDRLLHLRYAQDELEENGPKELVLALDTLNRRKDAVESYRRVDLFRIHMTERKLRHLALLSCPAVHRILLEDCATFAYKFVTRLLTYARDCDYITEEELKREIKCLASNIHIRDKVGESEPGLDSKPGGEIEESARDQSQG